MIRKLVDFALENRFLVLAAAILLFLWGAISFHQLPVEAYPDVANNYVDIITQWPGIAAEQIEQQVTIPIEVTMNGIPHVTHLRSFSLFGLSYVELIFDDEEENAWNRERVLERLLQVTLPPGVTPQMGTDWSPVGQVYFFTLQSTNPNCDVMELKSIEDWVVEKNFKSVPNVVDVASFGGPTREYQVRVDPNKLIAYGLSLAQVEQQLTNNNANAGGSFIEAGLQQINVREVGLVRDVRDIENTVIYTKAGTPLRVKDIAAVDQGPKIRLGQFARAVHREEGKIIDDDDVVSGILLLRRGADADITLQGIHEKVKELNERILPSGVKVVPFIDRIRSTIDLREQVVSFPPQPVITEDNLVVSIDSVIYFQVTDAKAATYEIANYIQAIEQLTVTTLRNVIGGMALEKTLTSRDAINGQLRGVLDDATGKWGIRVNRVELKAIDPPASIQDSMEKQMRADRDKRAAILQAEGERQSQILQAEGQKQAAILQAEGEKQSAVLRAEGQSKAIETVFAAIHEGKPDAELLAYQYLQTLPQIAQGEANKVWIIPSDLQQAIGRVAGAVTDLVPAPPPPQTDGNKQE